MKRLRNTCTLILFFLSFSGDIVATKYVPGQLIVQVKKHGDIYKVCSDLRFFGEVNSNLHVNRLVSKHLHAWLLEFDHQLVSEEEMLLKVLEHQDVVIVQYNHIVKQRAILPNDSLISEQWQYVNTGNNGGVFDADIDADEAWDITTGGLTPTLDTIVACVLDDGIDLQHPDFGDNLWRNIAEIEGNGIDDDMNGYVDDKAGWSIITNSDDISGGGHGTPVAGIIGAKGNNGIGVSGVNWDVKVMVLKNNFNTNEAEVLEAYEYPLTLRKRYNETGGLEGAFVVSTNASWGIDFGQPSNAPLWCAMYDTLGAYGILSCGATINANENVDLVGDLPTACPSDYLISVTNCNNADNKVSNAGYGVTTIDLGAPGANAYTTNGFGSYSGFGGTSGATPHVTGAIALLYSAPCFGLSSLAMSNPALAASKVKQYILDGVDPNTSLQGITVTGGRLNLYNSLLELLSDCPPTTCIKPFGLRISSVSDTSSAFQWYTIPDADSVAFQFRIVGSGVWNTVIDTSGNVVLNGLMACTEYEFRLKTVCDTSESAFTQTFLLETDGCCIYPENLTVSNITDTSAQMIWNDVLAANSYNLQLHDTTAGTFLNFNGIGMNTFSAFGLSPCTVYEVGLLSMCDTGSTAFSPGVYFRTSGCGACFDLTYCDSYGDDASEEWIANVSIGTINNNSGSDDGYGDYTGGTPAILTRSNSYVISLTPGYSGSPYLEYFRVWIDLNQDGDFDDIGELVFDPGTGTQSTVSGSIMIPSNAELGLTRMRVAMKWNSVSTACEEDFSFGEVEDYCVMIQVITGLEDLVDEPKVSLYPNPASDLVHLSISSSNHPSEYLAELSDPTGRVYSTIMLDASGHYEIDVSNLSSGLYFMRITVPGFGQKIVRLLIN